MTELHLEFLRLKGGCTVCSEYIPCQNTTLLEMTLMVRQVRTYLMTSGAGDRFELGSSCHVSWLNWYA